MKKEKKKKCYKCGKKKLLIEFHMDRSRSYGVRNMCKLCSREYQKKYQKTPNGILKGNINRKDWRKRHPESMLWSWAKARCKKKNLPFNIEVSDIIIPEECPILKIPLVNYLGGESPGARGDSPSLDQFSPGTGYVKYPNGLLSFRVISHRANAIRNNASLEELKMIYEDARRLHGNLI